jgi:hypothetical protein
MALLTAGIIVAAAPLISDDFTNERLFMMVFNWKANIGIDLHLFLQHLF